MKERTSTVCRVGAAVYVEHEGIDTSRGVAVAGCVGIERIRTTGRIVVGGIACQRCRANGRVCAAAGVGKERIEANGRVSDAVSGEVLEGPSPLGCVLTASAANAPVRCLSHLRKCKQSERERDEKESKSQRRPAH